MEEIIKKLNAIRGMLLLDRHGNLYVINEYTTSNELVNEGFWPFKKSVSVDYVDCISYDRGGRIWFDPTDLKFITKTVNAHIDDRNRYLKMTRRLNEFGYTIKRK